MYDVRCSPNIVNVCQAIRRSSRSPTWMEHDLLRYTSTSKVRLKYGWHIETRQKATSSRTLSRPRANTMSQSCSVLRYTFLAVHFDRNWAVSHQLTLNSTLLKIIAARWNWIEWLCFVRLYQQQLEQLYTPCLEKKQLLFFSRITLRKSNQFESKFQTK